MNWCMREVLKKLIRTENSSTIPKMYQIVLGEVTMRNEEAARTPWLVLRQGYDSIIKCVGPCSNTAYELNLPDLVDHTFRYSIDGRVFASDWNSWFFFTSFTGKNIDIRLGTYCSDGVAVSSSPTNWED